MEPCRPWLCQGDVFERIPIVTTRLNGNEITFIQEQGTALLLTEGCQLDKRLRNGQPKATRYQFAPLHAIEGCDLGPDIIGRLERQEVNPPELVYVDDIGDGEAAFGMLSEAFMIPSAFFAPDSQNFTGVPGADPADPHHMVATRNGDRLASMSERERHLLQSKMALYWTKHELPEYVGSEGENHPE